MPPESRGEEKGRGPIGRSMSTPVFSLGGNQPFPEPVDDQETPTGPVPNHYIEESETPSEVASLPEDYIDGDDADFQSHYSFDQSDESSDSSEMDEPVETNGVATQRSFFHSTGSLPGPNAFAPPFYNRPPTPLPPSPSLTSLLRPSFSTTTSRPTTPDSSDVETPNDTEAAVAKSARTATTVPSASPKVPTYEYYGFVLYVASSLAFLIYLLWSYLPSPFLHQLGIYYYPNRWWSLAIPSFLVMTIIYIYVALASYNTGYLTLPMNSIENIVDEAANIAVIDSKGRVKRGGSEKMNAGALAAAQQAAASQSARKLDWKNIWNEGTDAVMDVPIGGVCEVLYGEDRDDDEDEALGFADSDGVMSPVPLY